MVESTTPQMASPEMTPPPATPPQAAKPKMQSLPYIDAMSQSVRLFVCVRVCVCEEGRKKGGKKGRCRVRESERGGKKEEEKRQKLERERGGKKEEEKRQKLEVKIKKIYLPRSVRVGEAEGRGHGVGRGDHVPPVEEFCLFGRENKGEKLG